MCLFSLQKLNFEIRLSVLRKDYKSMNKKIFVLFIVLILIVAIGFLFSYDKKVIEQEIVDNYCTAAFIEKEYSKILNETGEWDNRKIPMLLGRVFSELVKEETWNIIKKYKNPTINYKTLNALVINKIKTVKSDIF